MMIARSFLFVLTLLLLPVNVMARSNDRNQPIDIEADSLQIDDTKRVSIYQGNVKMRQGSLQIQADRIELHFNAQNELLTLDIKGQPATLRQITDNDEPVSGQARHIVYSDHQLKLKLTGEARFVSKRDSIDSEWITINTDTDAINAGSIKGKNRVRMLVQPKNNTASTNQ